METLDYEKIIKDVNKLVQTDFVFDMECKLIPKSKEYTQEEAKEMADLLSSVYSISHCVNCKACGKKYLKDLLNK